MKSAEVATLSLATPSQATQTGEPVNTVPLVDLGHRQCRFPVKENPSVPGGHLFCGQATAPDQVYCTHHRSVVTAVEQRRSGSRFVPTQRRAA